MSSIVRREEEVASQSLGNHQAAQRIYGAFVKILLGFLGFPTAAQWEH